MENLYNDNALGADQDHIVIGSASPTGHRLIELHKLKLSMPASYEVCAEIIRDDCTAQLPRGIERMLHTKGQFSYSERIEISLSE